jgi:hypothetical protein
MLELASNGISLNRVLSVILILGLEDETSHLEVLTSEDVNYLSKVLLNILFPYSKNHLLLIDTSERYFLKKHYDNKYLPHFSILLSKLQPESYMIQDKSKTAAVISEKPLPAVYPKSYKDHLIDLEEVPDDDKIQGHLQKYESAGKRLEFRTEIEDLDEISPLEPEEKLKQLETDLQ